MKAFSLRIPNGPELSIDVDAVMGPADSGELGADLSGLFVELGAVARDHGTGILLTIDELHYVDPPTFTALIVGLHRASQERLPITVAGAGLPTLAALTGEAKTYAERMFQFPRVDSLTAEQAIEALQQPALDEGVRWSDEALEAALTMTKCYPYFLQEFGRHAWDVSEGPDEITADDFSRSIPLSVASLDDSFFRVARGGLDRGRADLHARDGGTGPRAGRDRRGCCPPPEAGSCSELHPRGADQTLPLLRARTRQDRLHGAPVRGVSEALDTRVRVDPHAVTPTPYDSAFVGLRTEWVAYGRPAAQVLRREIADGKDGDPLAPISVIVPSNHVGVASRRLLASGTLGPVCEQGAGMAAVTFLTVYRLGELLGAPRLAADGRRPVSTPVIAAAFRTALASRPGVFGPVASHPATEMALVSAYRELRDVTPGALDRLAGQSHRAGDVVRLHRTVRRALDPSWYDEEDLLDAAVEVLGGGHPLQAELGRVVVYLPERLSLHGAALLRALADRGQVVVVAGATGDPRCRRRDESLGPAPRRKPAPGSIGR